MPYIDHEDGSTNWQYETEALGMGDPIRVALHDLMRNIEAYLWDYNAPGYAHPEFLSWAYAHAKATYNASGAPLANTNRWDPSQVVDSREEDKHPRKTYSNLTVEALAPGFTLDNVKHKTTGDDPYKPGEYNVPNFANRFNGEPTRVSDRPQNDETDGDD